MFALNNPLECVRINKGFHVGRAGPQVLVGVKPSRWLKDNRLWGHRSPCSQAKRESFTTHEYTIRYFEC